MMGKSIAILGQGETAVLAPFQDPSWEIWTMAWVFTLPRVDLRFDIHHPNFKADPMYKGHINSHVWEPEYVKWIATHDTPVMCHAEAVDSFAPMGIEYPVEEVQAFYAGKDVLECTPSYMLAYAIMQKPERIGFWGMHFLGDTEYLFQLASFTYLMGYADAAGIKTENCPGGGPLMFSGYDAGRYGVDHGMRLRYCFGKIPKDNPNDDPNHPTDRGEDSGQEDTV
jgi:hypothetical protein